MQRLSFVIGANSTGKTHFIEHHFADEGRKVFDILSYQNREYDKVKANDLISSFEVHAQCLLEANKKQIADIIEALKQGYDVVAEQTFFKPKRRMTYIDAIRKEVPVEINVFVMCPSEERLLENIKKRNVGDPMEKIKKIAWEIEEVMEFPNPVEGFDAIYEVVDDEIRLRMDEPDPAIIEIARKELSEEAEQFAAVEEEARKRDELLESMETRPFWHYCEVCGRKEYMTAQEAFDDGWDYPPRMGEFGVLGPRTCGDCSLQDTLYWKNCHERKTIFVREDLMTPEEKIIWHRIKNEPESLLEE